MHHSSHAQTGLPQEYAQTGTLILGVIYVLAALPSPILIERVGRRMLLFTQLMGCALCLCALCTVELMHANDVVGYDEHSYILHSCIIQCNSLLTSELSVIILALFMALYGVGSSVPWLMASELFSHRYRAGKNAPVFERKEAQRGKFQLCFFCSRRRHRQFGAVVARVCGAAGVSTAAGGALSARVDVLYAVHRRHWVRDGRSCHSSSN